MHGTAHPVGYEIYSLTGLMNIILDQITMSGSRTMPLGGWMEGSICRGENIGVLLIIFALNCVPV
jgi:hypothetical protein